MANKREFLITKKALAEYLGVSRPTLDKRLKDCGVDITDIHSVLSWVQFESMGASKAKIRFNEYIWETRGEKCQRCGSTRNLQIAHVVPRSINSAGVLIGKNVRVLCVSCHNLSEQHPRIGAGKATKINNHYVRNERARKDKNKIAKKKRKIKKKQMIKKKELEKNIRQDEINSRKKYKPHLNFDEIGL